MTAVPNFASALIDSLIESNRGDRDAFSYNGRRYSYQDVAALMNRTGNMLRERGVETGGRVLLLLPASPAFVASVLGGIKAGAVPILGAPVDPGALAVCIEATKPAAAIVHEQQLSGVEPALAALARDAVVVVGNETRGYPSFVEQVRGQASWLAPQNVPGDSPALGFWRDSELNIVSHSDLSSFAAGSSTDLPDGLTGAILRAFARGEEATFTR